MKIDFSLTGDGLPLIEFTPESDVDSAVLALSLKQHAVLPTSDQIRRIKSISFDARPFFGNMPYVQCDLKGAQEAPESKKTDTDDNTQDQGSSANEGQDVNPGGQNSAGGQ